MTEKKLNLLVVEDNPNFRTAAAAYLSDKADVSFAIDYAGGHASALLYIVERDERWRNLRQFDGAMIDCFFPPSASTNTEFGKRAIEKMLAIDPVGQRIEAYEKAFEKYLDMSDPILRGAIRIHGFSTRINDPEKSPVRAAVISNYNLGGKEFASHFAKNILTPSKNLDNLFVDHYDDLRKAIEKDPANQPLGILVAEELEKREIPFVLTTSTNHHHNLTQPIANYCQRKGWRLIDCPQGLEGEKTCTGFWERAYEALEREMGGRE